MIAFIFGPGQQFLGTGRLPEISIERIEFQEGGRIIVYIRNTGPIDVTVAQADVNDRILPAAIEPSKELPRLVEAKVIIPFPWNEGEPYEIGVTSPDGTRFSKGVNGAAPAATPDIEQGSILWAYRNLCRYHTSFGRSSVASVYQEAQSSEVTDSSQPNCWFAGLFGN